MAAMNEDTKKLPGDDSNMSTTASPSSDLSNRMASESIGIIQTGTRPIDKSPIREARNGGPSSSPTNARGQSLHAADRTSPSNRSESIEEDVTRNPGNQSVSSSRSSPSASSSDDVYTSMYYSKSFGPSQITYLNDIARKYVNRGEKNRHAVVIFTFVNVGDKWRTSEEHPAIIIPSKLLPPNPPVYGLAREEYDHRFVNDTMMYLANEIEEQEGVAPFVSCIDFGHYEIGHEVDYVVSTYVHDALLYLYGYKLQPSKVAFAPSVPTAARYHHHSSRGAGSSFQAQLLVERRNEESIRTFTQDHMQGDDDPTCVPHSPVFEEESLESITAKLGKKLKKNLDAKLKLYAEQAPDKAVIFTNDVDLWSTDIDPVIITSEPLPPIRARRYHYDNELIAENILEYLIKTARIDFGLDINVHYLRFESGSPKYEAHLILMRDFLKYSVFMKGVCDPSQPLPPQVILVQCNTGIPLPPYSRSFESVAWVQRQTRPSSETRDDEPGVDQSDSDVNEEIICSLSETLREDLDKRIRTFIEMRCKKGQGVTVIFSPDCEMFRTEENLKIEFAAPLSPDLNIGWDMIPEITDYLHKQAERKKVTALNVSCLGLEYDTKRLSLVLSQRDQPALAHLEECEVKPEPSHTATKVSDGIYRYRSPVDGGYAPKLHVRVTRILETKAD